ncbi:retrovirus-related pol polyprotein from transposon TNT 1-94 [Tanacetum coccineum]
MDVKTAFLNRILREEVYVSQPDGFVDPKNSNHVYKPKKSLYVLKQAPHDVIFASTKPDLCETFSKVMCSKFKMSMMGKLSFFLGLQISQCPRGIFLNKSKFTLEIIKKYGMETSDPVDTPMVDKSKLDADPQSKEVNPTYTRRSTSRSMQLLGDRLVSWSSKKQKSTVISSTKAEYIDLAGCCAQILWIRSQLIDYGLGLNKIPLYHFIKEQVENRAVQLYFVRTQYQLAYILTKALGRERLEFLINKLRMRNVEVFRKILDICPRVQGVNFTEVPDDESTLTFLIDLGYKGLLYKHPIMYVDHMHQPWRTLAAIINKCLSGKAASNDRLRKSRINILWGMFYRENVDYPELIWEDFAFQIDNKIGKDFQEYGLPKKSRGKGSQGKKTVDTPKAVVDVFEEFDSEPARKRTDNRRVKKKKVSISIDENIILEPDVALEIVTESDPDPAGRRPSEKIADTMQALKASRKSIRSQPHDGGSSEGTGTKLAVPSESTVTPKTSSEGTGAKPGVLDKEKATSEPKLMSYLIRDLKKRNDDDDDKSIDLEKTNDEETDDEFMHSKEHVQDDVEETDDEFMHGDEQVNDNEDEEMTNTKDANTENGDEEITNTVKADPEKTEEPAVLLPILEIPVVSLATNPTPPHLVLTISIVLRQTTTPIPSSPITIVALVVTTILDPLPAIIQRVSVLEKDVQELKSVDHTTTLLASLRSEIPSAVNAYLGSSLGDALQKALQKHTAELIQ